MGEQHSRKGGKGRSAGREGGVQRERAQTGGNAPRETEQLPSTQPIESEMQAVLPQRDQGPSCVRNFSKNAPNSFGDGKASCSRALPTAGPPVDEGRVPGDRRRAPERACLSPENKLLHQAVSAPAPRGGPSAGNRATGFHRICPAAVMRPSLLWVSTGREGAGAGRGRLLRTRAPPQRHGRARAAAGRGSGPA